MNIRDRRTALGWSRKQLAQEADVDKSMLQLIELGLSEDDESKERCHKTLLEAEAKRDSQQD